MADNRQTRHGKAPTVEHLSYYRHKLEISRHFVRVLITTVTFINILLLVPDLIIVESVSAKVSIAVIRVAYSIILALVLLRLNNIDSFRDLAAVITCCELAAAGLFFYVFSCYGGPGFLIQAMGIITLVIITFVIPNLWGCMLFAAIVEAAGFFICAVALYEPIDYTNFAAAVSYVASAIALCAASAKNAEIHQIREFAAKSELERISSTDYLTDTANRFKLNEEAERWMAFCKRQQLPLSLVFFDVDDLKQINDEFGHPAGDSVLASVAGLIKDRLRSSDILARWGGDEFVMLLPNVSVDDAVTLSKRIMDALKNSEFVEGVSVTCSFGVAEMKSDSTFETLVEDADGLMYKAKRGGKAFVQYKKSE